MWFSLFHLCAYSDILFCISSKESSTNEIKFSNISLNCSISSAFTELNQFNLSTIFISS